MRAIALVTLLCLAGPTPAWGECAWVLWVRHTLVNFEEREPVEEGRWTIDGAMPTYAACIEAARKRAGRSAEKSPEAVNVKEVRVDELIVGGFTVHTALKVPEGSSAYVHFQCFPDTVRP